MKYLLELFLCVLLCLWICKQCCGYDVIQERNNYREKIGEKFIIDTDTLTIVDFSMLNGSYTLSNGVKVDKYMIKTKEDNE